MECPAHFVAGLRAFARGVILWTELPDEERPMPLPELPGEEGLMLLPALSGEERPQLPSPSETPGRG